MKLTHYVAIALAGTLIAAAAGGALASARLAHADAEGVRADEQAERTLVASYTVKAEAHTIARDVLDLINATKAPEDVQASHEAFVEAIGDLRATLSGEDLNDAVFEELLDEVLAAEAAMLELPNSEHEPVGKAVKRLSALEQEASSLHAAQASAIGALNTTDWPMGALREVDRLRVLHATMQTEFGHLAHVRGNEGAAERAHSVTAANEETLSLVIALLHEQARLLHESARAWSEDDGANADPSVSAAVADLARLVSATSDVERRAPPTEEWRSLLAGAQKVDPANARIPGALQLIDLAGSLGTSMEVTSQLLTTTFALREHAVDVQKVRLAELERLADATVVAGLEEVEEHREIASEEQSAARLTLILTAIAIAIIMSATGAVAVARLRQRLAEFDTAASALARGELDAPPPPLRDDELDPLSAGWAHMVGALHSRDREIAEKSEILLQNERMASLGGLLAGVAHEVNNPLAFVKSNEELSLADVESVIETDPALSASSRDTLSAVRDSLVANLDGLSRIEKISQALKGFAGRARDGKEPVDMNDVVEGVLIIAHNRLKTRFKIVRRLEKVPPVEGSAQELGQVVLNLVINAAEAAPPGSAITIRTHLEGDRVRVAVEDEGPGVPPAVRPRLFGRFATTKKHGTGLGLYLSRSIAESHGGTLDLDSSSSGACFAMRLPIRTSAALPAPAVAAQV